jgi:hypothetical protein
MKTKIFVVFLILSFVPVFLFFQSCQKIKNLAKFDLTLKMPTVTVPVVKTDQTGLIEQNFEFPLYINIDSIRAAHKLSNLSLENGRLTEAKLRITSPATATLVFLHSARIALFTATINELQVAHSGTIDPNANSTQFILDDADISPILNSQHFKGRFYYIVDNAAIPAPIIYVELTSSVTVTVSPL